MNTKVQEFVKQAVSDKNTIAEIITLAKTSKISEIKNILINDILSYEGELEIELITDNDELKELINNYIINYKTYNIIRLDDSYYKNKELTVINLISHYIKYFKFEDLQKLQLEKTLNSKTVEQHITEFKIKLQNCKSEKDLINLLKYANITPLGLTMNFNRDDLSYIDFLNLRIKKLKTSQEKESIQNELSIFMDKSNWDIEFDNYVNDSEKQIAIFNYKPLNIKIGAIGITDSYDQFESDGFIEVKFSEKVIMVWQPK